MAEYLDDIVSQDIVVTAPQFNFDSGGYWTGGFGFGLSGFSYAGIDGAGGAGGGGQEAPPVEEIVVTAQAPVDLQISDGQLGFWWDNFSTYFGYAFDRNLQIAAELGVDPAEVAPTGLPLAIGATVIAAEEAAVEAAIAATGMMSGDGNPLP